MQGVLDLVQLDLKVEQQLSVTEPLRFLDQPLDGGSEFKQAPLRG
jgi:hypothetical protein